MEIFDLPFSALTPYEHNVKKHTDKDVSKIVESIKRYGFNDPLGVWGENNLIVEGHGRYIAAQKLGMDTVPCIRLDHLTEQERREYAIVHNKSSEYAEWDEYNLAEELKSMDLTAFGFQIDPQEDMLAEEDVFDTEASACDFVHDGDIFVCGGGTLMCGDSTSIDDVSRLCGDAKIDLLLTDPPYGVDYQGAAGKIENDDLHGEKFTEFLTYAFENAVQVMRPGATFYVWFADIVFQNFYAAITGAGLKYSSMLLWVKNTHTLGHADYQRKHEPCMSGTLEDTPVCELAAYGWKEGAGHTFRYNRKQSTVLEFPKPQKSSLHPTMKPVPLWDYLIKAGTAAGDNVLDLFTGSGTTLIACEQNGRHAFCMEKDPHYASAAVARWEAFTGKKAVKVN